MHADEASNLLSEAETLLYSAKHNKSLSRMDKNENKKRAKALKSSSIELFRKAGDHFTQIKLFKSAAQCYYTSSDFDKAADLFFEGQQLQQAADCYMKIKNYSKAAKMFEDSNLPLKAFECYELEEDWEGLLLCLNRQKHKFRPLERDTLINRYVPIALNSIYHLMNNENDDEQRKLEEKYKIKKTSIIEEENELSDSDSSLDGGINEEKQPVNIEYVDEKESESKQNDERKIEEKETPLKDDDEEQIITSNQPDSPILSPRSPKLIKQSDSSFSIISKAELDKNFDHLSNFDPDDEFLRSEESFSVIGSLVAKDVDSISEYSDFSIVSDSRVSQIRSSNVIQTERDIYIEDVAMQKIIYYISFFSDDVKRYLNKIRSKEGLLQMDKQEINIDFFELELDNIDSELIKLILDVLEHFDMFRLCLIVCNRYGMQEHVSRYLTSICYKYSNLKYLNGLKILKINDNKFREDQKHVNILANEAIHSMLKLINPNMIKQIKTEMLNENSKLLNAECWRYIYYLGFWKKLVYIMDTHSSLQLCYSVKDFENFKTVYLINYREELLDDEIRDLINNPNKQWIDETTTGFLKYLCNRLDIELSASHTSDPEKLVSLREDCQCNINVNKFLACKNTNKMQEGKLYILEALKQAYDKFSVYCKIQSKVDLKSTNLDYKKLLDLFDIFYLYGRIFREKYIREGIRLVLSDQQYEHIAISYIFKILDFLVNFIEDTTHYSAMFTQDEVEVIIQALFIPQEVRSFNKSKLTLSTLTTMLMSRNSPFFKHLETYVNEFRADKHNREFIKLNTSKTFLIIICI